MWIMADILDNPTSSKREKGIINLDNVIAIYYCTRNKCTTILSQGGETLFVKDSLAKIIKQLEKEDKK